MLYMIVIPKIHQLSICLNIPLHPNSLYIYISIVKSIPLHLYMYRERDSIWQCVKTNSTPSVHIKIAGK